MTEKDSIQTVDMQHCNGCDQVKPLNEFNNDKSRPNGKTSRCAECNRTASNSYAARRREEDPLWNREYFLNYQANHRDYFNDYQSRWLASSSVTAQRNKDNQANWRAAHPDEIQAYAMQRRAQKIGTQTEKILRSVVAERDGWICQLCGDLIDPNGKHKLEDGSYNPWYLHIDHIIPLSKGGTDTYDNVQATHARCNLSKNARTDG